MTRRSLRVVAAAVLLLVALVAPAHAAEPDTVRIAGATRYETAVAVSQAAFPSGADAVVVATGREWPDALGGTALAGAVGGPVLLVQPDQVPGAVAAEIGRLGPAHVYVLGGGGAIAEDVSASLAELLPDAGVTRLGGLDRYETAALVASATVDALGDGWDGRAFVATGLEFADALAGAPLAVAAGRPILLAPADGADEAAAVMGRLGVLDATILGGSGAVSDATAAEIAGLLGGAEHVDRLAGADRHATALAIAKHAVAEAGFSWSRPGLATSADFPDALAAGPLLGAQRAPLLLSAPSGLADPVADALHARRSGIEGFTVFGGTGAVPSHVSEEAGFALVAPHFDSFRAMAHVGSITAFGPRGAGGTAEHLAFDHVAGQLRAMGYDVAVQDVAVPGGSSHNVIAEKPGTTTDVVLFGAHLDSKPPSPGGNDNASGVAVVLELARLLADAETAPTVRFVVFGAEEISGPSSDDHHFGSRQYVAALSAAERARIHAMVSVDMVGYGDTFNVRSMGSGPQSTVASLQAWGAHTGQPLPYLRDPGRYGWSDHEGFERVGIPAAWVEWRQDPDYHTVRDTAAHVQPERVRASGRLLRGWVLGMTPETLDALR